MVQSPEVCAKIVNLNQKGIKRAGIAGNLGHPISERQRKKITASLANYRRNEDVALGNKLVQFFLSASIKRRQS
jgi:hypothetical protein